MSVAGSANADVPIGVVLPYGGFIAPKGGWWLLCDGSVFDPIKYSALYSVIGTQFGGTANAPLLPDMRGRYGLGYTAGVNSIGEKIAPSINGTESFTLTASNIPTLSPLDGTPTYTISVSPSIYQKPLQNFKKENIGEPSTQVCPYISTRQDIVYTTTLSGVTINYTNEAVEAVENDITGTSIAYSGYDMTFIIKAKGF